MAPCDPRGTGELLITTVEPRQVWMLAARGYGETKKLLESKGIQVSTLRKQK
ncbi:hypothetical protein [Streptomyces lavendulocolor]|uniref:hypothetical protein n=1 Tax=Streptomyces lavendulocolor TaxID=67316 RepID=UPI003C2E63B1